MKRNNKFKEYEIFKPILSKNCYSDFCYMCIKNKEIISKIDINPITNYQHEIINTSDFELFIDLYKKIKFYLENQNFYSDSIQEGIALVVAKILLLNTKTDSVNLYLKKGNVSSSNKEANPMEELMRLITIALKEEVLESRIEKEYEKTIEVIRKIIDGWQIYEETMFLNWNWIDELTYDYKYDNGDQFIKKIIDIRKMYQDKIMFAKLDEGKNVDNEAYNNLLKEFDNMLVYAIKNASIKGRKTKKLGH